MADISTELARILSAIYGEDVRGSIHDAIEKINNVSEVVLTTGTDVTGPSSSSTGFYDGSLYLNTDTFELWKCTGVNTWASQGTLKGEAGDDGNGIVSIEKTSTSGLVDTYTITYTDGNTDTFTVTNGEDGTDGNDGVSVTGVSLISKVGLLATYRMSFSNGTYFDYTVSDGATSTGDMLASVYDNDFTIKNASPTGNGIKDYVASAISGKVDTAGDGLAKEGTTIALDLGMLTGSNLTKAVSGKDIKDAIEQIYADNGVLGAKNLFRTPYYDGTSKTSNGVTFTVNNDGSITVNTNGVASTGEASFRLIRYDRDQDIINTFNEKTLKKSGTDGDVYVQGYWSGATHREDEFIVNASTMTNWNFAVYVASGKTIDNVTIYPMLRLASDPDDTYVPYAMTNKELTEDTQEIKYRVGILSAKMPYYVANATIPRKKTLSSAELTEARARAAEQDYKTVVPGDIIIGPNTGSEYYLAKCWGRKGMGDSQPTGGAALTPNLMLMLYKPHGITRLWAGYENADKNWRVSADDLGRCPWNAATDVDPTDSEAIGANNTNITRAYNNDGTSVNVSGYMGSFIRKMLDERLLVDCFEADFGAANILPYRSRLGNTIKTDSPSGGHPAWNGLTNNAAWYTRKLDLPSEPELFGSIVWSSSGFDVGIQNEQLPFLQLGDIDLFFPRFDIWTLGVVSSSDAALRRSTGAATDAYASYAAWACPLGCIR